MFGNTIKHIFLCFIKCSFGLFTASKFVFSLSKKWSFYVRYLLPSQTLIIQIFNMSIQVSLSLKLIVQVTLALTFGTLFNSVLPTYVISQPTPVANTQIIESLFTDKRTRKVTSVAISIPSNLWKLPQGVYKVFWHNGLNIHIESSPVFSVCYKIFLGVLKAVKNNI